MIVDQDRHVITNYKVRHKQIQAPSASNHFPVKHLHEPGASDSLVESHESHAKE